MGTNWLIGSKLAFINVGEAMLGSECLGTGSIARRDGDESRADGVGRVDDGDPADAGRAECADAQRLEAGDGVGHALSGPSPNTT